MSELSDAQRTPIRVFLLDGHEVVHRALRELPDGSGIDVCRRVRSRDPSNATLMLTSYDDDALLAANIAERTHLAEKTVKNYVPVLLGVERCTQAVVLAARRVRR